MSIPKLAPDVIEAYKSLDSTSIKPHFPKIL